MYSFKNVPILKYFCRRVTILIFRSGLPEVFRQLQELDEKRIKNIKNFIRASVDIERNVFPIINKCLDGILKAADIINEKEVSIHIRYIR